MKAHSIGLISLVLTTASIVGSATSLPATAATFYNVLDLGATRESGSTFATGINDFGQVIGFSPSGESFRTAPNTPINPATDIIGLSDVNDINNSGRVVGTINSSSGLTSYLTQPNGSTRVNAIFIGDATGINDSGQVTGRALVSGNPSNLTSIYHAVLGNPDNSPVFIDLGTLGGSQSTGTAINNLGQVVGISDTANGGSSAFRTAANSPINSATDDLGTLGGLNYTIPTDINDLGQTVGYSSTGSGLRAFRTGANRPIDPATDNLGTIGDSFSAAYSINNSGLVVGVSGASAFVYDGNELFNLNTLIPPTSDFVLIDARGINEAGQIAATGLFTNSRTTHAFLLTPVPEPTTMLGILAFSAGAGLLRKKFKQKLKA